MTQIVLFQKELSPGADYIPARDVHIFAPGAKPDTIQKESMRRIRFGYRAYLVKFNSLPPEHILMTACEEAVRNKTAFLMPMVSASQAAKNVDLFSKPR